MTSSSAGSGTATQENVFIRLFWLESWWSLSILLALWSEPRNTLDRKPVKFRSAFPVLACFGQSEKTGGPGENTHGTQRKEKQQHRQQPKLRTRKKKKWMSSGHFITQRLCSLCI